MSGTSRPPTPSHTTEPRAARATASSRSGSIGLPSSSAAQCGETAGPKVYGATSAGSCPVVAASSSWSIGHSPGSSSSPVTTGLNADTGSPRATSAAQIAAATTVFPAPVSVPVTKTPCT